MSLQRKTCNIWTCNGCEIEDIRYYGFPPAWTIKEAMLTLLPSKSIIKHFCPKCSLGLENERK